MVCSPLGGALCRAHGQYPGFAPDTSEVADGFLALLYLVHKLSELLTVIFSPLYFLCICRWRRCLFRCGHCSKGSQIPAHLLKIRDVFGYGKQEWWKVSLLI